MNLQTNSPTQRPWYLKLFPYHVSTQLKKVSYYQTFNIQVWRKPAFIQIILHISQIKRLLRFDSIGCWWMKSTSENVRITWLLRLMVLLSEDVYYFTWLKTQYADHFYIHFPHPMHCLSLAEDCLVHLLMKTGKVVLHPSTVFNKLFSNNTNSTLKWINAICCQLQRLQSYGRKDICLLFSILKIKCTHAVTFFLVDLWILFPGWNWRTEFFNINASTGKHNEKGLLHNGDKLGWFPPPLPPTSKHKATLNNHLSQTGTITIN